MVTLHTLTALPTRVVNIQLITEVFLLGKTQLNELYNSNLDGSDHKDPGMHGYEFGLLDTESNYFQVPFHTTTNINLNDARLAQLVERQSAVQEVEGLSPRPDQ